MTRIICINKGRPNREQILEQIYDAILNDEPLISDEEAFLRHLIRKWNDE